MRIAKLEPIIVSVPYRESEHSSRIKRDGVTDVLVRLETDDGRVGWESCSGANVESIAEAVKAAIPMVVGRNPWNTEAIAADYFKAGLWDMRPMTGNFAYAGIDMALWDLCGQDGGEQPLYNLFGGLRRRSIDYLCYLKQAPLDDLVHQCQIGLQMGYTVFYIKVGIDFKAELEMVRTIREAIGPDNKIRIDANAAWSVSEAVRRLAKFDRYDIDFVEAPVPSEPVRNMVEIKRRTPVTICANEGLGRASDVWEYIRHRAADVLCFSPYWVGTLATFHRLAHAAHLEGIRVVKHTHGELGIAATACQHLLLTLPNVTDGHQQVTAFMDDVLAEPLPIATSARWGVPSGPGLGLRVDEDKVRKYHELYQQVGQFLPYKPDMLAREEAES